MLALLLLADSRITDQNHQSTPGDGTGIGIIIAVIVVLVVAAVLLYGFIIRRARASKGGVQPPIGEAGRQPHPQNPPFESIERRS